MNIAVEVAPLLMQKVPGSNLCAKTGIADSFFFHGFFLRLLQMLGYSPRLRAPTFVYMIYSSLPNVSLTVHYELTIQNHQRDAPNTIYSSNIITLLYMFRVSSTHLQEDIVVHKQHMVPSLSVRVLVSC